MPTEASWGWLQPPPASHYANHNMERFNLWMVTPEASAVIAFGDRESMESLAGAAMLRDTLQPSFPRLDLRVLPDRQEP